MVTPRVSRATASSPGGPIVPGAADAGQAVRWRALVYRLRRFGEITKRDLGQTGEFAEVWPPLLALGHLDAG